MPAEQTYPTLYAGALVVVVPKIKTMVSGKLDKHAGRAGSQGGRTGTRGVNAL